MREESDFGVAAVVSLGAAIAIWLVITFAGWILIAAWHSQAGAGFGIAKGDVLSYIPMIKTIHPLAVQFTAWRSSWSPGAAGLTLETVRMVLSGLAGIGALFGYLKANASALNDRHVAGRQLLTGAEAAREFRTTATREAKDFGEGIRLHPRLPPLSLDRETKHFEIFGGVGSGKTQTIYPMICAAQARGDQLIIWDIKCDFSAAVPGLIFAPWDARSPVWHVAADVRTPVHAAEFSTRIVPEGDGSPMWHQAARQVLTGCLIELLATRGTGWGFGDLASAVSRPSEQLFPAFQRYYPEAQRAVEKASVTTAGILINLMSALGPIFHLAQAWPAPIKGESFSVRHFLEGKSKHTTLLLPGNGELKILARAFVGAVVGLASQWVTSPACGESKTRRLWFFLDEFPQLRRIDSVFSMVEIGRSKGVRVVIGMQDIAQARELYGDDVTDSLLSMVGTTLVGRLGPGETADFVSETLIGGRDIDRTEISLTTGAGAPAGLMTPGGTRSMSVKRMRESAPLPATVRELLGPDKTGVRLLFLGYQNALVIHLPYTQVQPLRPAFVGAKWLTELPRDWSAPVLVAPPEPTAQARQDASPTPEKPASSVALEGKTQPPVILPTPEKDTPVEVPQGGDVIAQPVVAQVLNQALPGVAPVLEAVALLEEGRGEYHTANVAGSTPTAPDTPAAQRFKVRLKRAREPNQRAEI